MTRALLAEELIEGVIFEPCAGPGGISSILAKTPGVTAVFTNDIDPQWPTDWTEDARNPAAECWDRSYDWVVTNPPFSDALAILKLAYTHARKGIAFLLRLSFLEPTQDRAAWLEGHADQMTQLIVFGQPRPSFTGDGNTDSVTAAWVVIRKDWSWKALGIGVESPFRFLFRWKSPAG